MSIVSQRERWNVIAWGIAFEGSIMLSAKLSPSVKITNTERDVIDTWQIMVSKQLSCNPYVKVGAIYPCSKIEGSKPRWDWRVQSLADCEFILKGILPYLPSARKRKVAELLLQFCTRRHGARYQPEEYALQREICALNAKGDKNVE
jgi:hypothetical protein